MKRLQRGCRSCQGVVGEVTAYKQWRRRPGTSETRQGLGVAGGDGSCCCCDEDDAKSKALVWSRVLVLRRG